VKQGRHSVGVKRQYCGQLGKKANCQVLVSLTLARTEVPVGVGLRLFLPEDWCGDPGRRAAVGVPEAVGYRPKWQIALDEVDRVLASGPASRACWPMSSTAKPPSSVPGSTNGSWLLWSGSCRRRRSTQRG
jgi:SRSO17 transposase